MVDIEAKSIPYRAPLVKADCKGVTEEHKVSPPTELLDADGSIPNSLLPVRLTAIRFLPFAQPLPFIPLVLTVLLVWQSTQFQRPPVLIRIFGADGVRAGLRSSLLDGQGCWESQQVLNRHGHRLSPLRGNGWDQESADSGRWSEVPSPRRQWTVVSPGSNNAVASANTEPHHHLKTHLKCEGL